MRPVMNCRPAERSFHAAYPTITPIGSNPSRPASPRSPRRSTIHLRPALAAGAEVFHHGRRVASPRLVRAGEREGDHSQPLARTPYPGTYFTLAVRPARRSRGRGQRLTSTRPAVASQSASCSCATRCAAKAGQDPVPARWGRNHEQVDPTGAGSAPTTTATKAPRNVPAIDPATALARSATTAAP